MEKWVDKLALLKQLFELACTYNKQELSHNKLVAQLQNAGNTTTLTHYINLLNSAHLLIGLQKYSGSIVMARNTTPKFQVYNNSVFTVYHSLGFKQAMQQPAQWGRLVEGIIGTHLVNSAMVNDVDLYYWRNANDEVDFVLVYNNKVIAIEVKSGSRLKSLGLQKFLQTHQSDKTLLVGMEGLH
jgi:uncharacterized protein